MGYSKASLHHLSKTSCFAKIIGTKRLNTIILEIA